MLRRFLSHMTAALGTPDPRPTHGVCGGEQRTGGQAPGCTTGWGMTTHAGEIVELRNFGTFRLRYRQARAGRNPRTGDAVKIPAKTVPVFPAGKAFQELVAPAAPAPRVPEEAVSP